MPKKLPPIGELSECPHCGGDEFYVIQRYSGKGAYHRRFNGASADNVEMYDCLSEKVGKTASCGDCHQPIARWDESTDSQLFADRGRDKSSVC